MTTIRSFWLLAGLFIGGAALLRPAPALACNENGYIGSICWTAATYCPYGYLPADGGRAPLSQYQALFAQLGTFYGPSDQRTYFTLPDLRGREIVGIDLRQTQSYNTGRLGAQIGATANAIDASNMPIHDHSLNITASQGISVHVSNTTATQRNPEGNLPATVPQSSLKLYGVSTGAAMGTGSATATMAGSNTITTPSPNTGKITASFPIIGPQLAMKACINAWGEWPERG